jgi:hypothetical protein
VSRHKSKHESRANPFTAPSVSVVTISHFHIEERMLLLQRENVLDKRWTLFALDRSRSGWKQHA